MRLVHGPLHSNSYIVYQVDNTYNPPWGGVAMSTFWRLSKYQRNDRSVVLRGAFISGALRRRKGRFGLPMLSPLRVPEEKGRYPPRSQSRAQRLLSIFVGVAFMASYPHWDFGC